MPEPTLEQRVTRLEELLDRAIAYGKRTSLGRVILERLGLNDA